jgi:hypothetical protein
MPNVLTKTGLNQDSVIYLPIGELEKTYSSSSFNGTGRLINVSVVFHGTK